MGKRRSYFKCFQCDAIQLVAKDFLLLEFEDFMKKPLCFDCLQDLYNSNKRAPWFVIYDDDEDGGGGEKK